MFSFSQVLASVVLLCNTEILEVVVRYSLLKDGLGLGDNLISDVLSSGENPNIFEFAEAKNVGTRVNN